MRSLITILCLVVLVAASTAYAQTTAFTYQGRLTDNLVQANGAYEMHFALYDSAGGGTQVGSTVVFDGSNGVPLVQITNGIFTAVLDFGATAFSGAPRYLQISLRRNPQDPLVTLSPRERITSAPYAIRALDAASVGGSPVPAGGFIHNGTSQQSGANFNISGNGTVGGMLSGNIVDSGTEYNIGGLRVLSTDINQNLRLGIGAGQANVGLNNSFVGYRAGALNASGRENLFVGVEAGVSNSTGRYNSFFGNRAGAANLFGDNNTFLGSYSDAGSNDLSNVTAIGHRAFVTQSDSVVLGSIGGVNGATIDSRIGIGTTAPARKLHLRGQGIDADGQGDLLVEGVGPGGAGLTLKSTGTGGREFSLISTSDGALPGPGRFGVYDGAYRILLDAVGNIGIGEASPIRRVHVTSQGVNTSGLGEVYLVGVGNVGSGITFNSQGTGGRSYSIISTAAAAGAGGGRLGFYDVAANAYRLVIDANGNVSIGGIAGPAQTAKLDVLGTVRIGLATPGASQTHICHNGNGVLAECSSSLRYKTNVHHFAGGLDLVHRLQPITFNWKNDAAPDLGLGAEDVEKVEPRLVTYGSDGKVEGVKYDLLGVVLVNAVKEQQVQITEQQEDMAAYRSKINEQQERLAHQQREVNALKQQVNALRNLVCTLSPQAEVCKSEK
jgi:polyhydroxyalkanoate synthesis regulator phasin